MPFLREDPIRWRAKADECRRMSGDEPDERPRRALLRVALAYEQLAEAAEFALKDGVKPRDWIAVDRT